MEEYRPQLEKIKQLSNELFEIDDQRENLIEQLNQYKTSVSGYIHKIRRAESLMDIHEDPDLILLTESTNNKVRIMEDKIQLFHDKLKILNDTYDNIFEKRKVLVSIIDKELNKTITYAYPFGMETPNVRMGKYHHITDDGDVRCEIKFESNSFFNKDFYGPV